jgi:hypothetical protein
MASEHLIPIMVTDKFTGDVHEATDVEIEQYKFANKANYTKWVKANRNASMKKFVLTGLPTSVAWAKAFELYPDTSNTRHRFTM